MTGRVALYGVIVGVNYAPMIPLITILINAQVIYRVI